MEKELKIPTKDKHIIYGVLNTPKKKTNKLVVFVHGFTGFKNEHIFFNAVPFFNIRGCATFRFDLYAGDRKARRLSETSISTHAADVNTVIKYFQEKYKKIHVIGHSLGGPSILLSDTKALASVILWDASYTPQLLCADAKFNKKLGAYVFSWGVESIVGDKMYQEWKTFDGRESIKKIQVPVKIIVAENGGMKGGQKYFQLANEPKSYSLIKRAGHNFDEEGAEQKLFEETYNWIKRF